MIVPGPDQRILKANQAFARLTGYSVDELAEHMIAMILI